MRGSDRFSTARTSRLQLEQSYAAPNYAPIPVVLERGEVSWLWDADGKRYLDFMSAYSAVSHGHAHPRLVRALIEQAQRVAVTSRAYHSTTLGPFLAKRWSRLADLGTPSARMPASGGCESVETAIKAARRWGYRIKGIAAGSRRNRRRARQLPWALDHRRRLLDRSVVSRRLRAVRAGVPCTSTSATSSR